MTRDMDVKENPSLSVGDLQHSFITFLSQTRSPNHLTLSKPRISSFFKNLSLSSYKRCEDEEMKKFFLV